MDSDPPAESATDRSALRWSDTGRGRAETDAPDCGDSRIEDSRDDAKRPVTDERDVERLEAELERKEEQLRYVTEQYEDLLAEKNRRLADDDPGRRRTTLRSRLARLLSGFR